MSGAESTGESQLAMAQRESERLRTEKGRTARELYRELLTFIERRCPAVFFQLNGKSLYELLRKGSQPVSGEVLKEYRAKAAIRMQTRPELPIPDEARQTLGDSLAAIWESAFDVARREATSIAEVRNAALEEKVAELTQENGRLREQLGNLGDAERALATQLEASQAQEARLCQDAAARSAEITRLERERDSLQQTLVASQKNIDELSQAIGAAQEARKADNKRALLEIDLARTDAKKLQKRLDEALDRTTAVESVLGQRTQSLAESQRALTELSTQLARLAAQQSAGVAEGQGEDAATAAEPHRSRQPARRQSVPAVKTGSETTPAASPAKRKTSSKRRIRSGG
jgi:hypothetical protein